MCFPSNYEKIKMINCQSVVFEFLNFFRSHSHATLGPLKNLGTESNAMIKFLSSHRHLNDKCECEDDIWYFLYNLRLQKSWSLFHQSYCFPLSCWRQYHLWHHHLREHSSIEFLHLLALNTLVYQIIVYTRNMVFWCIFHCTRSYLIVFFRG